MDDHPVQTKKAYQFSVQDGIQKPTDTKPMKVPISMAPKVLSREGETISAEGAMAWYWYNRTLWEKGTAGASSGFKP